MNDSSSSEKVLAAGEMENRFRDAADLLEAYIVEGTFKSEKTADIAITHLVCRSLADLRWGQYLAGMGYPIQMFSVIRPVSEAVNLIELFAAQPDLADAWAAGDYQRFGPAQVRRELGIEKDDIYSWMCEHSHPRFAGFQITTYNVIRHGEEEGRGVMKLGELSFDFPAALIATVFPGLGLANLAGAAGHAVVRQETALKWPTVARQVAETLRPGFERVWTAVIGDAAQDDEALKEMLAGLDQAITAAREMEAIIEEATTDT